MSKKFYLVKRSTGERFKASKNHYAVLYDSGYAAFVKVDFYTYITTADPKEWEVVLRFGPKTE